MKNASLYIILFALLIGMAYIIFNLVSQEPAGWELVYRNDPEGNAVYGDKSRLIHAVREGLPIRIGWGGRRGSDTTQSVEHTADAQFLTIANGTEVFAQISPIFGQAPFLEHNDSIKIRFREKNNWVKMAGTNGYSTALMIDYQQDTLVNPGRDRKSSTSWFVKYPSNTKFKSNPLPLW